MATPSEAFVITLHEPLRHSGWKTPPIKDRPVGIACDIFTRAAPQTGTQFRAKRELLHSSFIFFYDLAILVILRMLRDGYIRRKSGRLGTDSPREWAVACS
jgi:hypothetical protein